eukprot:TRINITY_DN77515_c0_g1_i1.p1 TRINITY_DN77515_c0_g1~~TRINITY_DN77515_c0_g1_i1.p1  ORF type:complete len:655 (-),score=122.30 TRINITY_DN77515_c0_g1_i1:156-2084(-)
MGKGGFEGKGGCGFSKGKGKGSAPYKTDLCKFFERGCCEKGASCPFAHGTDELRVAQGTSSASGKSRANDDGEVMSWLKEQREQGGPAGDEFEALWKAWCKTHQLSEVPKAQRIKSIYEFRAHCETLSPAKEGEVEDTSDVEGTQDHVQAGRRTGKARQNVKLTCPRGHCMKRTACGEEEYECDACSKDIKKGSRFYDCRECDYSLCRTCAAKGSDQRGAGRREEAPPALPEDQELPSDVRSLDQHSGPEEVWDGSVILVRKKLEAAVGAKCLDEALSPDYTPGSSWQQLAGRVAQCQETCRQRCAEIAGSFLDGEGLHTLTSTCLGLQNLAAVSRCLDLRSFLRLPPGAAVADEQLEMSLVTAAFLAELFSGEIEAASKNTKGSASSHCGETAARALADFVCLAGFSHFVALGVVRSASSDNTVAETHREEEDVAESGDTAETAQEAEKTPESEEAARARRVLAQQQRRSELRWDYTGGYRRSDSSKAETNEEAMLRMIGSRCNVHLTPKDQPSSGEHQASKYKQQICMFWEQGNCTKGEWCTFAHGRDELGSQTNTAGMSPATASSGKRQVQPHNFKRHLCTYFQQGRCDKGERCTFAHGPEELEGNQNAGMAVHRGPSWEVGPTESPPASKKITSSKRV